MSIIRPCEHNGCNTLTLGRFCIRHEPPVEARVFPRGRPFPARAVPRRPKAVAVPRETLEPVRGLA
jgi:hypothetical protein